MKALEELDNSFQRCGQDPLDFSAARREDGSSGAGGCPTLKEEGSDEHPIHGGDNRCLKARKYGATFVCLAVLERWLELGSRPSEPLLGHMETVFSDHPGNLNEAMMRLWKEPLDDLKGLKQLVNDTRRLLWRTAVEPCPDSHLQTGLSKIPKAGLGLFAAKSIPSNTICCYYSGDVHSVKSSQSTAMIKDTSYLLRIGTVARHPWWYEALQLESDAKGDEAAYASLREHWDQIADGAATTEFFVDPTNPDIKARYINDCLREEDRYNVRFVLDPIGERAAVVSHRDIRAGEELYVSYGQAYWDSMEATTGVVPRQLPTSEDHGQS